MTQEAPYKWLSAILFTTLPILILLTFRDYGISWDEKLQDTYGEYVVRYYTSFFRDTSAVGFGDLHYYGGFFEALLRLFSYVLPLGIYEVRHLITGLFGVVGVVGCWKIARLLAGPRAAFFGALLLALYPPYYGHIFINSKDIPFAVLYVWAVYYLVKLAQEFPKMSGWTAARFGIASGLTMGVRVGGLLLLCYLFLTLAILLTSVFLRRRSLLPSRWAVIGRSILGGLLATILAYGIMLIFWPAAIREPFVAPFEAMAWFSRERPYTLIRSHVPMHLLYKLPELYLLLILVGLSLAVRTLYRYARTGSVDFPRVLSYGLVVLSALLPVIYAVITKPFLYDEIRHFLFVIPPLFSLLGIALSGLMEAAFVRIWIGRIAVLLLVTYFSLQIRLMHQLHPYEYAYYNRLVGGVQGANQNGYATEYWATSYKEGVEMLESYLRRRDGALFDTTRYSILLGAAEWCAPPYFPGNFVQVQDPEKAEFLLTTTRYDTHTTNGPQVLEVQRFGVSFMVGKIMERDPRPGELTVSRSEITAGESYVLRVPSAPRSPVIFRYSVNGKDAEEFTASLDDRGEVKVDITNATPKGLYRFTSFRRADKAEWTPAGATLTVK